MPTGSISVARHTDRRGDPGLDLGSTPRRALADRFGGLGESQFPRDAAEPITFLSDWDGETGWKSTYHERFHVRCHEFTPKWIFTQHR